jgi:hypothetical protein
VGQDCCALALREQIAASTLLQTTSLSCSPAKPRVDKTLSRAALLHLHWPQPSTLALPGNHRV